MDRNRHMASRTIRPDAQRAVHALDSVPADAAQMDLYLAQARAADRKAAARQSAPAGQIPLAVTEAFIRFVSLLNDDTDGPAELDLIVRSRATGETAGVVPVTEDTAVAILAAMSGTAVAVRAQSEPGADASVRKLRNTPARALHLVGGRA